MLLTALLLGCGTVEPDPPRPPPAPKPTTLALPPLPEPPTVRAVSAGSDDAASLALAFTGVGALHRGFFSAEKPLAQLAAALAPCVRGEVVVRVTWQDDIRLGRITLEVPPDQLACAPQPTGAGLDLAPLEPVGRALAAYRDAIAAGFDFRVASFRGEVRLVRPGDDCLLRLGGQFPPDGTRWHPCVEVGSHVVCAPDPGEGVARIEPPSGGEALQSCLGQSD